MEKENIQVNDSGREGMQGAPGLQEEGKFQEEPGLQGEGKFQEEPGLQGEGKFQEEPGLQGEGKFQEEPGLQGQEEQVQQGGKNPQETTAHSGYGTWSVYSNGQSNASSPRTGYGAQGTGYGTSGTGYGAPKTGTGTPPYPGASPVPIRQKVLNTYQERLKSNFGRYGFCALFIGILTAFCFYHNPNAITYPLFIGAIYGAAYWILPSLGFAVKKDSLFLVATAFVLAGNSAATASSVLHNLNTIAQILLGSIFLIHQGYEDKYWDITKYFTSIILLWFEALASLPIPFSYSIASAKKMKHGRNKNILMLLGGCLAAVPAVIYLGYLLADADAVFKMILEDVVLEIFNPSTLFGIAAMIFFSTVVVCCLMGSVCSKNLSEVKETERHNPLAAISFTAMIALLYLFFCGIQIIYLFAGKGKLPADMTYSEYARQGFFQLLAVAVLNLIFVLNCFKYFHKHSVLTFFLTVISLCTYVMIASAAYRMLLYVGAYYLTFLRLFVLWFLGVLAILMLGVLASIFLPHFRLFRWCLVVITLAYCGFAWSMPDYQIARYNIAQEGGWITLDNVNYFIDYLSVDAAPALAEAPLSPEVTYEKLYCYDSRPEYCKTVEKALLICDLEGIPWSFRIPCTNRLTSMEEQIQHNLEAARNWEPGIRSYNFSTARAKKMLEMVDGK